MRHSRINLDLLALGCLVLFAATRGIAQGYDTPLTIQGTNNVTAHSVASRAAGGLTYLSRTLGLVCGVAALAALFAHRRPVAGFDAAFGEAFMLATALVGAAALIAIVRFRRLRPSAGR